ncbi:MAG: hypothetical protein ACTS43_00100 [Candidatus Hodgkinia cicadicola]
MWRSIGDRSILNVSKEIKHVLRSDAMPLSFETWNLSWAISIKRLRNVSLEDEQSAIAIKAFREEREPIARC